MQQIPNDKNLSIEKLAACFKNTTATYIFYWLLSIIEALEDGFKSQTTIFSKHDIFARMVSNAWYTVNYFHVSFGKLDNLQTAINTIKNTEGLTVDADKKEILKTLLQTENKKTKKHSCVTQ